MGEEQEARPAVPEDIRKKISAGMKASHAKRRKQKKVVPAYTTGKAPISAARRSLIEERDALNVAIKALERRGL